MNNQINEKLVSVEKFVSPKFEINPYEKSIQPVVNNIISPEINVRTSHLGAKEET